MTTLVRMVERSRASGLFMTSSGVKGRLLWTQPMTTRVAARPRAKRTGICIGALLSSRGMRVNVGGHHLHLEFLFIHLVQKQVANRNHAKQLLFLDHGEMSHTRGHHSLDAYLDRMMTAGVRHLPVVEKQK